MTKAPSPLEARGCDQCQPILNGKCPHSWCPMVSFNPAAEAQEALMRELVEAIDRAHSAVWDAHYGKGISVGYAQTIDAEVKAVLAHAKELGYAP